MLLNLARFLWLNKIIYQWVSCIFFVFWFNENDWFFHLFLPLNLNIIKYRLAICFRAFFFFNSSCIWFQFLESSAFFFYDWTSISYITNAILPVLWMVSSIDSIAGNLPWCCLFIEKCALYLVSDTGNGSHFQHAAAEPVTLQCWVCLHSRAIGLPIYLHQLSQTSPSPEFQIQYSPNHNMKLKELNLYRLWHVMAIMFILAIKKNI